MDVDSDLDGKLLQQFSSMGTTDREVLISEFQKLLGNTLNPDSCAFFLDMNNWNLQAAICSYYDFEQPSTTLPSMALVCDVTVGDGEAVAPNTRFIKTWRIKNPGTESWPPGCCLRFCGGDNMAVTDMKMVDALGPGECYDVGVEMTSPQRTGVYQGQWRMSTPTGHYFGEVIWVVITVEENGLLGVTQQMSRIGDFATPQQQQFESYQNRLQNQMALIPVSSSNADPSPANPFGVITSQTSIPTPTQTTMASPVSRWLLQSSTDTGPHTEHSQDTEMS